MTTVAMTSQISLVPNKKSRAKRRLHPLEMHFSTRPRFSTLSLVHAVAQASELRLAVRGPDFVGSGHLRRVYSLLKPPT